MDTEAQVDAVRESQLRRLLEKLEGGAIDASEYAGRVRALELSEDPAAMAAVVDAPAHEEPVLDAVDLVLLSRQAQGAARRSSPRVLLVAVMGIVFLVLLVLGLWLVAHARALHGSGSVGAVFAASSPPSTLRP